jgi:hypothetical protein
MAPNIQYKYGKLYIDYSKDNIKKEIEIYEDGNDSNIIKQIKNLKNHRNTGGLSPCAMKPNHNQESKSPYDSQELY